MGAFWLNNRITIGLIFKFDCLIVCCYQSRDKIINPVNQNSPYCILLPHRKFYIVKTGLQDSIEIFSLSYVRISLII